MTTKKYPCVLTIAGSDCSGGAGIQADIKTISALGAYAASAITAITVQNTCGVTGIHPVPCQGADRCSNDRHTSGCHQNWNDKRCGNCKSHCRLYKRV